ncbi:carboxypeptidase regulatory-like domain-containing protein [Candidatus Berkelbacteria bacterium]|nr:carboxypeptidase regulatory-like domain-containing protein [Candidatus Berkelbacteria bacterium]
MKKRGILFGLTVFLSTLFVLGVGLNPQTAQGYGTISNIGVSVADTSVGATGNWTISFTVQNAIPASTNGGRFSVSIQGVENNQSTGASGSSGIFTNATVSSPSTISHYSQGWSSITLQSSEEIAAGSTVSVTLANVRNPQISGYYFAKIYTSQWWSEIDGDSDWGGDYNSAYFEIGNTTNLTGTVTNGSTGAGVAYAYYNLNNSNYSVYYNGYTDKDGKYGIGSVPAGTYTLRVSAPTIASGTSSSSTVYTSPTPATITIAASGVTTQNMSFASATKTISGRVVKSDGTGVNNANVWASSYGSSFGGGYGYASARTDSSGNFTFTVTGGTWQVGVSNNDSTADWTICGSNNYQTVSFATDTTTESKSITYTATTLSATITGTIVKPDGTAISQYGASMSLQNTDNCWFSPSIDANGSFSVLVVPGTYTVSGWVSDNTYSFPSVDKFSVGASETKALGTITLTQKTDRIQGTVTDSSGNAISGASVNAWKDSGAGGSYEWANATSGSDGSYSLLVTPGTWKVSSWPSWSSGSTQDLVTDGKPVVVTVTSGVVATQNFTFQRATNTVSGRILDADGNVVTSLSGWVNANDGSQEYSGIGATVSSGTFTLKLPSGTWEVSLSTWGSDYSAGDSKRVTFAGDNETQSLDLSLVRNDVTLQGTVYDEDGAKVTNTWMNIYATKGNHGSWQNASFDTNAGTYSIKVSAGTWRLGWWVNQSLGYSSGSGQDVELTLTAGETKTYDITLKKADSTIRGRATKSNGDAMAWAWIAADTRDPNEKTKADSYYYSNGASTNQNGDYEMKVPAGTYWVGGYMWSGSGVINPKRVKVTVDASTPATVDLTFRDADASIQGNVRQGGSGTDAFVTAWAEDGGYSEANSSLIGIYGLSVSSGTKWHVKAIRKDGADIYKSPEKVIDLSSTKQGSVDLDLEKQSFTLPDTQSITFDPTKQQAISLDDGTALTIPANTIATSGTVTLTAEPTVELAEEADAKPVSYGYEYNAIDQNGTEITNFSGNITLETKYDEDWLEDANVQDEEELIVGYYDTTVGTWKELSNCTVNKDQDTVSCQTDHFTAFALVTASDTTPPAPPTNVSAGDKGTDGDILLSWTNPTDADFASINIYRSTASGQTGTLIKSGATGTSYEDSGLTNGTKYYYTLYALDASGNISNPSSSTSSQATGTTTSQASATPTASVTLPATGNPL